MKKRFSLLFTVLVTALCLTLVACDGFNDDDSHDEKIIDYNTDGIDGKPDKDGGFPAEDGKLLASMEVLYGDVYMLEIEYMGVSMKFTRYGRNFNLSFDAMGMKAHMIHLDGVVSILDDDKEIYTTYEVDGYAMQDLVEALAGIANTAGEVTDELKDGGILQGTGEGEFNGVIYFCEEYVGTGMGDSLTAFYNSDGNLVGLRTTEIDLPFFLTDTPDMNNLLVPSHYREVDYYSGEIDVEGIFDSLGDIGNMMN